MAWPSIRVVGHNLATYKGATGCGKGPVQRGNWLRPRPLAQVATDFGQPVGATASGQPTRGNRQRPAHKGRPQRPACKGLPPAVRLSPARAMASVAWAMAPL
ncbi:hypothetical protein BHE74_00052144 [Ensete ventricosum]|nr:hypothetical protein BHE74_00052144 [Ensete ventricosum]